VECNGAGTDTNDFIEIIAPSGTNLQGAFIIHYVERIVYIELSRNLIIVLTLVLCGLNVWLYLNKK
jgi:hypothetical protein